MKGSSRSSLSRGIQEYNARPEKFSDFLSPKNFTKNRINFNKNKLSPTTKNYLFKRSSRSNAFGFNSPVE